MTWVPRARGIGIAEVLLEYYSDYKWAVRGENYSDIEWHSDESDKPTQSDIEGKLIQLQNAEPMRLLREVRNEKLTATDWWCSSDRTPTQAQLDYRSALRDLPETESPRLDKNGFLIGVVWPIKPE